MRTFILLSLILLLTACASSNQSASNWVGSSMSDLTRQLGQPSLTTTAANGNTLLVYSTQAWPRYPQPPKPSVTSAVTVSKGRPMLVNTTTIPEGQQDMSLAKCTYFFEVNAQNIIVNTKSQGFNCAYPNNFLGKAGG